MGIRDLSDEELKNLIENYRRKGKTEGDIYPLAEALMEKRRRGLRDLSDKDLEQFIKNYRKRDATEGGIYPLAKLLMEQLRRSGSVFSGKTVATKILTLAQSSDDNLTTYHDLWNDLYPDREWIG